jgi:transposase
MQMTERRLFEVAEYELESRPESEMASKSVTVTPRLRVACRDQVVMRMLALDQMLPADDEARTVVAFVEQVDLSELYRRIRAVEGGPGQAPIDPLILLSLWLFATIKGVGSARELDRLCRRHLSYQWICGDVSVNYHTLADFRVNQGEFLNGLLTRQIAQLMSAGAVTLERVAQDGVRVRASAGASSFRRKPTLEQCLVEAEAQVKSLREEVERDPAAATRREQAARERAAREREQRVRDALVACDEVHAAKEKRGRDSLKQPARGSTTDPDARKMKMPDGGTRPAFNVQFATDTASQVIVGVDATNAGTDAGQLGPMSQQIKSRTGQRPQAHLADGGFASDDDLEDLNDPGDGPKLYLPVRDAEKKRAQGIDPFTPLPKDSPARAEWRQRMGTEAAQAIYKERASTAECVNALARQRGLTQFRVRGLAKVKLIATWFALAHNVLRWAFFQNSPRMAAGQ